MRRDLFFASFLFVMPIFGVFIGFNLIQFNERKPSQKASQDVIEAYDRLNCLIFHKLNELGEKRDALFEAEENMKNEIIKL
jgi:hypothetical protein